MFSGFFRSEINEHAAKLIIGMIAISLAIIEYILTGGSIDSISESYFKGDWPRNIFVGFLFVIAAFMFTYNGKEPYQMAQILLSKVAALAALGVALFPCACNRDPGEISFDHIHGSSAAVLFIILAIFCRFFYLRAKNKEHKYKEAKIRAAIYKYCGIAIVLSIGILALDYFSEGAISSKIHNLTFIFEYVALASFGFAWLTASRFFRYITNEKERYWLFGSNPEFIQED